MDPDPYTDPWLHASHAIIRMCSLLQNPGTRASRVSIMLKCTVHLLTCVIDGAEMNGSVSAPCAMAATQLIHHWGHAHPQVAAGAEATSQELRFLKSVGRVNDSRGGGHPYQPVGSAYGQEEATAPVPVGILPRV